MRLARLVDHTEEAEDVLAAALLSLVWLVPNHQLPWTAFHHELLMVIALSIMLLMLAWQSRQDLRLPWFGVVVLVLGLLPWLQHLTGLLPKFGTAFISSAYLMAAALAVMVGFSYRESARNRFTTIFLYALVLAALMNLPIQLSQWFQWYSADMASWASILVTPIGREQRPSGSILQPNLLATLQIWALLGLTWLRTNGRLSFGIFLVSFIFISIGLGLTQSRAGILEMAFCTAVLCLLGRRWAGHAVCYVWAVLLAILIVWSLHFQAVAQFLDVMGAAEGRLSAIDGARIDAWYAFVMAIAESPWWGYGIADVGYPYILQAETHPHIYIGQRFAQTHNVVLDLALWMGVPIAVALTLAAIVWGLRYLICASRLPAMLVPMLMLMSLTIHAMLELPHQYLFLLVPAGLCVGLLSAAGGAKTVLHLGRLGTNLTVVALWAAAAIVSWDYFPYQERYTEWRFDSAKVGTKVELPLKPALILTQLHDELALYRSDFSKPLTTEELQWIEQTTRATTSGPAIFYTALAHGMSDNRDEARKWMMRYNAVVPPHYVDHIQRSWLVYQAQYPVLAGLDWPAFAGRRSTFRFETVQGTEP